MMSAGAPQQTISSLRARTAADAAAVEAEHRGEIAAWVGPAVLFGYWLINMIVVSPLGNFPLNDDWIYSESVAYLLRTGEFHLLGCSPTCFLHVAFGAAAGLVSGFSFEHLRVLTTLFGLSTSLLFYVTLIKFEVRRPVALVAALVLSANPLFVNVSYSFMTDVPAMFFGILSTFFMAVAIKKRTALPAAASGAALCCAVMVRQTSIAFALSTLVLLALDRSTSWRFKLSLAIFGLVAPAMVAATAENSMTRGNEFIGAYDWYKEQFARVVKGLVLLPVAGVARVAQQVFQIFCYMGLFCLPLLPMAIGTLAVELKQKNRIAVAAMIVALMVVVPAFVHTAFFEHKLMPFSDNLWRMPMVGPINLMGICVAGMTAKQKLWMTCISAVLGLVALAAVLRFLFGAIVVVLNRGLNIAGQDRGRLLLAVSFIVAGLGTIAVQTIVLDYDRYYLMALPAVLICAAMVMNRFAPGRTTWILTGILCAGLCLYTTCATQDYMSWNRARWQATRQLERAGVSPLEIDGGPEYNYLSNPNLIRACKLSKAGYVITHRGAKPYSQWRWWPVSGEQYIIAFNTVPGYEVIGTTPYFGALTMNTRTVYTLKRSE